ncbi:uncharacterized protein [Hoplias malabaricus]|uniref:uncharacterized protein n=1 Tax=Hoplias malabaricus TaxID=27720 RepID=UPI003461C1BC
MPTHHLVLISLLLVAQGSGQWINCGRSEELFVQPGDNVTLQCDCKSEIGWDITWIRICTPLPMVLSTYESLINPIPRHIIKIHPKNKSNILIIENITKTDLGLYYCTKVKSKLDHGNDQRLSEEKVYRVCNTSMKVLFEVPSVPSTIPVTEERDCSQCWLILQTVCLVCFLLSALLTSVFVFCCCHKTGLLKQDHNEKGNTTKQETNGEQSEDMQVYYASLNIPKGPSRRIKRNPSLNPDFSVYSELNKEQH